MEVTHNTADTDRLMSFAQALTLVGISRSQVYVLLGEGKFPPPTKIGRTNYFSRRELLEWIELQLSKRGNEPGAQRSSGAN